MENKAFFLFSGHNDRAVLALCRFFSLRKLPFCIIASSKSDFIFQTCWAKKVILIRKNKTVDIDLFKTIRQYSHNIEQLIYCPTTEFINNFLLDNREDIENLGFKISLPLRDIYQNLSNKKSSSDIISKLCDIKLPPAITWGEIATPCVFKPKENINAGSIHYPVLCFNDADVKNQYATLAPEEWFVQKYIQGQSHYLCGYLSSSGEYTFYWQTNCMQQPNGKSIVLAKTGKNPGFDESLFFNNLFKHKYHGPLMMEIIEDSSGQIFYIEINPRFWGPLQLAVDAHPKILDLFAADAGFLPNKKNLDPPSKKVFWYAWAEGAQTPGCRIYPAIQNLQKSEVESLINQFDVFKI